MDRQWGDLFALMELQLVERRSADGTVVSVAIQRAIVAYLFAQADGFAPRRERIREHLGSSRDTVRRAIEVLQSEGLISADQYLTVDRARVRSMTTHSSSSPQQYDDSLVIDSEPMTTHSSSMTTHSSSHDESLVPNRERKRNKRESASAQPLLIDPELEEWIARWNDWADARLVAARVTSRNQELIQELIAAWGKFTKSPAIQDLLRDRATVERALRASFIPAKIARGELVGWFDLPGLLENRRRYAEKLMDVLDGGKWADAAATAAQLKADMAAAAEAEQRRRNAEILSHKPAFNRDAMLRRAAQIKQQESVA